MRHNVFILGFLGATGCSGLGGDWTGSAQCDGDMRYKAVATIERVEGREYNFETRILSSVENCFDGQDSVPLDCDVKFSGGLVSDEQYGDQNVDVSFDECKAVSSEGSVDGACVEPIETTWDGADEIVIKEPEFFGFICSKITLNRD